MFREQLSIATLSTMFIGTWAMTGGKKAEAQKGPPINASSKDEESFIQYVHRKRQLLSSGPSARRYKGD